jgi:hypothetical protein
MKKLPLMFMLAVLLPSASGSAMAQAPIPGQPYQVPPGYESYQPGTLIAYGGYSYVIQGDGTMLLSCSSVSCDQQQADDQSGCQVFQVPDGYSGCAAGTVITYGDLSYALQGDGTMALCAQGDDSDSGSCQFFQVPDGYSGFAAGSIITYGGASYAIGVNGTMVLLSNAKQTSNYKQSGNAIGSGPRGGLAQNPWYPSGGFRSGPGGDVVPNTWRPRVGLQPGPGAGVVRHSWRPSGRFRPGPGGGVAQRTWRPSGRFRSATGGGRFGGMGARIGRRGRR